MAEKELREKERKKDDKSTFSQNCFSRYTEQFKGYRQLSDEEYGSG